MKTPKIYFALCFCFFSFILKAQFSKFDGECTIYETHKISELLDRADETEILIFIDMDQYEQWSGLEKTIIFENLECLSIKFTLDPESSDSLKMEYIRKLKNCLSNIEVLFKSPKLKKVNFTIGEQLFLTSKEVEKFYGKKKKQYPLNLKNAWNSIGKDIQEINPKLKIAAENWNW